MVISVAYPLDVYCDSLIVCITDYYTFPIGQQIKGCTGAAAEGGQGGRLPPQYSSMGGLAPPINRSYDDRVCIAAAAYTRCVSKRTTTIYMYARVLIVAPPPIWQFACRVRAYI